MFATKSERQMLSPKDVADPQQNSRGMATTVGMRQMQAGHMQSTAEINEHRGYRGDGRVSVQAPSGCLAVPKVESLT